MPYKTNNDLPDSVKDHLPEHAQDIYRETFNNAFVQYHREEDRAHAVAWGAVKKKYHKNPQGKWVKGPTTD